MDIKKLLGKRIKELRKAKNLTQEDVAEKINIEPKSLSNIETGKYYPTAENLEKILCALEVTPEELFKISHLQSESAMHEEINQMLYKNPDKIPDIYKILKALIT